MTGTSKNGQSKEGVAAGVEAIAPAALRILLEKTPVAVWAVDGELRLTFTGGAGLVAVGLRPGEGVGLSLYEHIGHDDSFPPVAGHLAALRGEVSDFEHEWRGRLMAIRLGPLSDAAGVCVGVIGVAFDVTEQREAERASEEAQTELRQGRRSDAVIRALRPRLVELEDLLSVVHIVGERVTNRLAPDASGGGALVDLDQLRRASDRGIDVVRGMGETINSGTVREFRVEAESGGGETILLVDDEPQVRRFVRRALEDQGYRVLEAGTVDEALSIGSAFEGRIHLLLTDVVLPGQNGPHLAARLAPVRPEMRILYMTGYADDAMVDRGVLSAGQSLLVKPFTSLGLAHEVKKALRT